MNWFKNPWAAENSPWQPEKTGWWPKGVGEEESTFIENPPFKKNIFIGNLNNI